MNSNFNSCCLILYLPDVQIVLDCFYAFQSPFLVFLSKLFWSSSVKSTPV